MGNLRNFMNELHIVAADGNDARLGDVMSWPQEDMITRVEEDLATRRPSRYIILKARQIGISTIVEGLQFALAMSKQNFKGMVVAQDNKNASHLLSMTKYYYKTFWAREAYKTRYAAQNQMAWEGVDSHVTISSAKTVSNGRGWTGHFLHTSEVAFWDHGEELMTGLAQSVHPLPETFIFFESTANGVGGFFYNTWNAAVSGDNEYVALFYPWWAHPSYTADHIGLGHLADGDFVPADDEERKLIKFLSNPRKVVQSTYPGMSKREVISRLVWRRYTLANRCQGDINKLHQEYPSVPEEAFIATGTNAFDLNRLHHAYDPINGHRGRLIDEGNKVRFIRDETGPLEIFKYPSSDRQFAHYMIGADGKKAVQSVTGSPGDYCCAQVVNRKTWEQVARWRGRLDQNAFGEELIKLGRFYGNAMLAPETGIGGPGVAAHIVARGYPHVYRHRSSNRLPGQLDNQYGFITNSRTKQEAIGNLQAALFDETLTLHDFVTYEEMKNYVTIGFGFGNADGKENYDDTVMALAIAITATLQEGLLMMNDPQYHTPRYHIEGYKSSLTPQQAVEFDRISGEMGVPEASVVVGGKETVGDGFDAHWLQDPEIDYYSEGDY